MRASHLRTCALLLLSAQPALGQDSWFRLRLDGPGVELVELATEHAGAGARRFLPWGSVELAPRVVLDGPGEAYARLADEGRWALPSRAAQFVTVLVRAPEGSAPSGELFCLFQASGARARYRFALTPEQAAPQHEQEFLQLMAAHYRRLARAGLPGSAWFRRRADEALLALGDTPPAPEELVEQDYFPQPRGDDSYELFTGARALAENLALDGAFCAGWEGERSLKVADIAGISLPEFDWRARAEGLEPQQDPLAGWIPADQHALFFPSFRELIRVADRVDELGRPLQAALAARGEAERTRERYERQLCIGLDAWARSLGPTAIGSVALTGSDFELNAGSDLALVFECEQAALVASWLEQRQRKTCEDPLVWATAGTCAGVPWVGASSHDRRVSVHMAQLDGVLVLSNSSVLLERILETRQGRRPDLRTSPEYRVFRDRYALGEGGESAFLMLTNATLRRWCSPRWRIGASRRIRALALLTDLELRNAEQLLGRSAAPAQLELHGSAPLGRLSWHDSGGLRSDLYGTPGFLTPIVELDLGAATAAEASAYARFRARYQARWSGNFDPLALRLSVAADSTGLDFSVVPLIASTSYRSWREAGGERRLDARAGDPHPEAALQCVLALDPEGSALRELENFLEPELGAHALDWIGGSIHLYAEADASWEELASQLSELDYLGSFTQAPLAIDIASRDEARARAFMDAASKLLGGSSEAREYRGQAVQLRRDFLSEGSQLAWVVLPDRVVVALRERLIWRAIDRFLEPLTPQPAWLGESLAARLGREALPLLALWWRHEQRRRHERASWNALPILNEWHRRFPDEDPVVLHERLCGVQLTCPGGGEYRWDPEWSTYSSSVFGHPERPTETQALPRILATLAGAEFGLTFEKDGLRARVLVQQH
jgi:hypothetical protein